MLHNVFAVVDGWRERRRTARALSRLDPRLLVDIGREDLVPAPPIDPVIYFRMAPPRHRS